MKALLVFNDANTLGPKLATTLEQAGLEVFRAVLTPSYPYKLAFQGLEADLRQIDVVVTNNLGADGVVLSWFDRNFRLQEDPEVAGVEPLIAPVIVWNTAGRWNTEVSLAAPAGSFKRSDTLEMLLESGFTPALLDEGNLSELVALVVRLAAERKR